MTDTLASIISMMSALPDRFTVTQQEGGVVVANGELDAASADALTEALDGLGERDTTLDMAGVSFVDSSGIRVLIEAHRTSQAAGHRFTISQPSAAVLRLLKITGLEGHLDIVV